MPRCWASAWKVLVLGDDLLGQVHALRARDRRDRRIQTSIEAMKQVCLGGPGHYLGSEQTLALMQTEYIYPAVGNRMCPKEWDEAGKPLLLDRAIARKNNILAKAGMPDRSGDRRGDPGCLQHLLQVRAP